MLLPLGRVVPPDPGQKWQAFAAASENEDRTRRMVKLVRQNALMNVILPLVLAGAVVIAVVAILVLSGTWAPAIAASGSSACPQAPVLRAQEPIGGSPVAAEHKAGAHVCAPLPTEPGRTSAYGYYAIRGSPRMANR
jgi:hypothetical protein